MEPKKPRRMDGYVRVSRRLGREGPGYISPTVQRDAISRWAEYRGVEIVKWHTDEDESGGTQNRPGIVDAISRVEAGETDGIACWRLNRFARNVSEALRDVKRVQAAGGALAFTEEDIDPTGPFGEFILTILLAVSALELNNLKASWRTAKELAVARGAHIGPTPFGYRREEEHDGVLQRDPGTGEIVTEAYERAARGGLQAAVAYLTREAPEQTWTTSTVRRFLAQRVYLGEVNYRQAIRDDDDQIVGYRDDLTRAGAHEPLTTLATWTTAQAPEPQRRRAPANFPLTGLATCATCGTHLVGSRGGGNGSASIRMYRCAASLKTFNGKPCPNPVTVKADDLDGYVIGAVRAAIAGVRIEAASGHATDLNELEADLLAAEANLTTFIADTKGAANLRRVDAYDAALDAHVAAVEDAQRAYRDAAEAYAEESFEYPSEDAWDLLEPQELVEALRRALAAIEVAKSRGRGRHAGPIHERVRLIAQDPNVTPTMATTDSANQDG